MIERSKSKRKKVTKEKKGKGKQEKREKGQEGIRVLHWWQIFR
jgi:hypothetical protein